MLIWNLKVILASLLLVATMIWPRESAAAQLRLSWGDNSNNENGFSIERRTSTTGYSEIAVLGNNVTSYTDSSVAGGTTYCYRLRAFNGQSYSAYSNEFCATTTATLSVSRVGSGTVTSAPAGINCGTSCSASYSRGASVTLTPTPASGYTFTGWSGAGCTGIGICMLSVNADTSVTATFSQASAFVTSITPNSIDLASPPTTFTITGAGFTNSGFGLSVVNFARNGVLLSAARATSGTNTSLTTPFPGTNGGAYHGLSRGPVTVEVWNQTGSNNWSFVGSTSLTVNDTRAAPGVNAITPNPIDLVAPPTAFTITGSGFVNSGLGLSVANFTRNGTVIAATRATSGTNASLTIPFPGTNGGAYHGLSRGPVTVEVWNQTGSNNWSFVGSTSLTVNDTRAAPGVNAITPNPIDLVAPPTAFTITGSGFVNSGLGLSVANFTRNGTVIAATRATSGTNTSLTTPFPGTNGGAYHGLSRGPVTVEVWNQTGSNNWSFVGSTPLTVNDTRSPPGVSSVTPNSINLASPPASFTITGSGFVNSGLGLSVANFTRNGTVIAATRATSGTNASLTIPFPGTNGGAYAGLSRGPVTVEVYNQIGANSWTLVGTTSLTVNDTR